MDSSLLLAHIVAQTKQNIEFLITHNKISAVDGRDIIAKLPSPVSPALLTPPSSTASPSVMSAPSPSPVAYHPPPPQQAPHASIVQGRALWGYNEQGQDPRDLSFHAGNIIEILAETNADWWTGRYNGREGLFPSTYVEKLPPTSSPPPSQYSEKIAPGQPSFPAGPGYSTYTPPSSYQSPPPNNNVAPYQAYNGPPPGAPGAPAPVAVQQEAAPKKHRFGGMGNTLAHSAVGGVGFGAGSAVGSGLINAIF